MWAVVAVGTAVITSGVMTSAAMTSAAATSRAVPVAASRVTPVSVLGRVVHVADGDTLDVDVAGDGTSQPIRVRLTGINAMELTRYATDPQRWLGDCHAVAAARRLYSLVYGKTVRVTAQDARSMSGVRYRRRIWVYTGGTWQDVALILLAEGHGLFLPNATEYAPNKAAAAAARSAARRGIGLWDTDSCGAGPAQGADLRVAVAWDAPGDDAANPDGEYVEVSNHSTATVDLSGWWVRTPPRVATSSTASCSLQAPECLPAAPSACTRAPGGTRRRSCTGASASRSSRTPPAHPPTSGTAATCSTRRATCARGSSTPDAT